MRYLIIFILLTGTALADTTATGPHSWRLPNKNELIAWGSPRPINYQKDDQTWSAIEPEWHVINQDLIAVQKGNHRVFVHRSGWAYYVHRTNGERYPFGMKPWSIIKFCLADSTYDVLWQPAFDGAVDLDGCYATLHDIYPGVHRRYEYDNSFYADGYIFTQEARDSLANHGPWAGYLVGTVSLLDTDSLNLALHDSAGAVTIDEAGRIVHSWFDLRKDGARIFALQKSFIRHCDTTTSVEVHKRVSEKNGQLFLAEFFDPLAVNNLGAGIIRHNLTFGNEAFESTDLNFEGYITMGGGTSYEPAETGTAKYIKVWLQKSMGGIYETANVKAALHQRNASAGFDSIATTEEIDIDTTSGYNSVEFDFLAPPTITAGEQYYLTIWGEPSNGEIRCRFSASGTTGDTLYMKTQAYGAWPDPVSGGSNYAAWDLSIYCYYEIPSVGQIIIIGAIDEKQNFICRSVQFDIVWDRVRNRVPVPRDVHLLDGGCAGMR